MATITIDYATIFMAELDKVLLQQLTSAPMEMNSNMIRYNGGDEVKIPKIVMEGLADYNRATGFTAGDVTLSYQTHTLTQDRGREFSIDAMDVDESNFVATAGNIMGEFQRTKVVPEIDAYRYSTIFTAANDDLKTAAYTPADATIFEELSSDISNVQDVVGDSEPLTIYMSYAAANKLDMADKIEKKLEIGDFESGGVSTKVKMLDGVPIIRVPSSRFKSSFTFGSDGFTADSTAMAINWIIAVNRALIAVNKQEKLRVFSPDVNQDADAWKMQYRRYHDLFIPDNKLDGLYVNYTAIDAPALTATVAAGSATDATKFTATAADGNTLGYKVTSAGDGAESPDYNEIVDVTAYTSGDDIDDVSTGEFLNMYELDSNDRVVKFLSEELESGDIGA